MKNFLKFALCTITFRVIVATPPAENLYCKLQGNSKFTSFAENINTYGEEFVIIFYATVDLCLQQAFKPEVRAIVLGENSQTLLLDNYKNTRHTQPFSIVFGKTTAIRGNVLWAFVEESGIYPRSFILFVVPSHVSDPISTYWNFDHQSVRHYHAMLIGVLFLGISGKNVIFFCNKYCDPTDDINMFRINTLLSDLDIPSIHKQLFWNANGRIIPSFVHSRLIDFDFELDGKRCWKFFPVQISEETVYCSYSVMSTLMLTHVHNFTTIDLATANYTVANDSDCLGACIATHRYARTLEYNEMYSQIYHFSYQNLLYCFRYSDQKLSNVEVWTAEPFTWDMWLFTGLFLFGTSLVASRYFTKDNGYIPSFVHCLAVFLGDSSSSRMQPLHYLCAVLSITGFVIYDLYGNSITRSVIVAEPVKGFEFIKDLLDNDYKILWPQYSDDPQVAFNSSFTMKRISSYLSNSFQIVNGSFSYGYNTTLLVQEKFAAVDDQSTINAAFLENAAKVLLNINDTRCLGIPENIDIVPISNALFTNNRYCMWCTVRRIWESGLAETWDRMARWSYLLWQKLHSSEPGINEPHIVNDQIEFHKITPCLVMYLVACALEVVLFLALDCKFDVVELARYIHFYFCRFYYKVVDLLVIKTAVSQYDTKI